RRAHRSRCRQRRAQHRFDPAGARRRAARRLPPRRRPLELALRGGRPAAALSNWLAAAALLLALMTAISWLGACFGLLARSVEAATAATFVAAFAPYLSSAFVPVDTMPGGLQWVADNQPVTPIADTLRALMLDTPLGNEWMLAIA